MILAVDPGGTTGVAYQQPQFELPSFTEVPNGHLGFVTWFDKVLEFDEYVPTEIVCESFIPRPGARSMQYDALYIIGWLSGWAHLSGVPFKLQSPAQAKSFATNEKLKAAGFYPVGLGHAQDAARHLLVHLITKDPQGYISRKLAKGLGL